MAIIFIILLKMLQNAWATELGNTWPALQNQEKGALEPPALSTYINKVRQVVDVVLEDGCIGCLQSQ